MKINLTKAQVDHLKFILNEDLKESKELHYSGSQYVDRRYTRANINHNTNILEKLKGRA
jgi:hypothetical protein